jgi:hypothetical protein
MAVTLLQHTRSSVADIITSLYVETMHVNGNSSRPGGLSGGPGQHGSIMTMMFVIFLSAFYSAKKVNIFFYVGLICSYIIILLSQSQTAFITANGVLLFSLFFVAVKSPCKTNGIKLIVVLLPGFWILLRYIDRLRYLMTLFQQGLNRHSYVAREEKAQWVMSQVAEKPLFAFLGFGKDYWGSVSTAMDNEYVFFFSVYGLFVLFTVLLIYCKLSLNIFLDKTKTPFDCMLLYMIVAGVVLAWPTAFITDPRILLILIIVFLSRKNILKRLKTSIKV